MHPPPDRVPPHPPTGARRVLANPSPTGPSAPSSFSNPAGSKGEAAARYVAALLDLLGDRDPMHVQEEQVVWLRRAMAGMDEDALARPEAPGKWSVGQVLRHLAD